MLEYLWVNNNFDLGNINSHSICLINRDRIRVKCWNTN